MLQSACFPVIVATLFLTGCLVESSAESTQEVADMAWRYDPQAPYYGYLPVKVQEARDVDPNRVAAQVCREMAGELEIIAVSSPRRVREQRIAFTCRIAESGMQTSLDFGDLVRVSSPVNM